MTLTEKSPSDGTQYLLEEKLSSLISNNWNINLLHLTDLSVHSHFAFAFVVVFGVCSVGHLV